MTWQAGSVLDTLKTQLEARGGLSGVQVATASMGDETAREAIIFFGVDGPQKWGVLSDVAPKEDADTFEGAIWINKPGAGEAVAKAARDRAIALFAELETQLRADQTISGLVLMCEVENKRLEQGSNTNGRWCQISFGLKATGLE